MEHRLNTTVDRALAQGRIVGAVVIVMLDGKVIYHCAAGYLDREAKISMSEGAIFRLTSSSRSLARGKNKIPKMVFKEDSYGRSECRLSDKDSYDKIY